MAKKIKVAFIDKMYYNAESKRLCGDMGFTFQESADTRVLIENEDDLINDSIDFINSEEAKEWDDVGDGVETDFSIYELYEGEIEVEDEDYDDFADILWSYRIIDGTSVLKKVFVCATEEDASGIVRKYYPNVDAEYRTEEED